MTQQGEDPQLIVFVLSSMFFAMLLGMLDAQLNALVTIAGTGGVGFAGDGGLGRLALLRHPEGLALKPNMASGSQEARPIRFAADGSVLLPESTTWVLLG